MSQLKLKNCPHCLGNNLKPVSNKTPTPGIYKCYIYCIDCKARGSLKSTIELAVKYWNAEIERKIHNDQTTLIDIIDGIN